jgi:hypothetical protein
MTGHIQRRGKASWRLKFEVDRNPVTGKTAYSIRHIQGHQKAGAGRIEPPVGSSGRRHAG